MSLATSKSAAASSLGIRPSNFKAHSWATASEAVSETAHERRAKNIMNVVMGTCPEKRTRGQAKKEGGQRATVGQQLDEKRETSDGDPGSVVVLYQILTQRTRSRPFVMQGFHGGVGSLVGWLNGRGWGFAASRGEGKVAGRIQALRVSELASGVSAYHARIDACFKLTALRRLRDGVLWVD